jgi:hypothetical protein
MIRDYGHTNTKSVPFVYENDDSSNPLLEAFLDVLEIDSSLYFNKLTAQERRKGVENSSVSIGTVVPPKNLTDLSLFELKETSFAHPDMNGTVPRIPFPHLERNLTIVYLNNGDQWDLWFSKGLSENVIDLTIKFIENMIDTQLSHLSNSSTTIDNGSSSLKQKKDLILQYLSITYQGDERTCFRRPLKIFTDFEPFDDVKTILEGKQKAAAVSGAGGMSERKGGEDRDAKVDPTTSAVSFVDDAALKLQVTRDSGNLNNSSFSKGNADMTPVIPRTNFWNENANKGNAIPSSTLGQASSMNPMKQSSLRGGNLPATDKPNGDYVRRVRINPNDIYGVTPDLLEFKESDNVLLKERRSLLNESCTSPDALLGWQVSLLSLLQCFSHFPSFFFEPSVLFAFFRWRLMMVYIRVSLSLLEERNHHFVKPFIICVLDLKMNSGLN